jgi:hypothetical protein
MFVGGHFPTKYPLSISISNPKGGHHIFALPQTFVNESSEIFYLKRNCHHKYEWVNSSDGEAVPYAIQAFYENAIGLDIYIGRVVFSDYTLFSGVSYLSGAAYLDRNGNSHISKSNYQVLTCKSKVFEAPPPPPAPTTLPSNNNQNSGGCSKYMYKVVI